MSEQGDPAFQKRIFTMAYQIGEIPSMAQNAHDPLSENLRFIFIVNGGVGIIQHWLKCGLRESPREIAEIIYDMAGPILQS